MTIKFPWEEDKEKSHEENYLDSLGSDDKRIIDYHNQGAHFEAVLPSYLNPNNPHDRFKIRDWEMLQKHTDDVIKGYENAVEQDKLEEKKRREEAWEQQRKEQQQRFSQSISDSLFPKKEDDKDQEEDKDDDSFSWIYKPNW